MKVIQLEDRSLLPAPCRTKKVNELITTLITEQHQNEDVKQKQPLKRYPLRHRKADEKTIHWKQGTLKAQRKEEDPVINKISGSQRY